MTDMNQQALAFDSESTSNGTTAIDKLTTFRTTTIGMSSSQTTVAPSVSNNMDNKLDQNAIIAGVIIGLLLIAVALAAVCLARGRRHRTRQSTSTKAGSSTAREPNPYTNPCFDGIKGEMGERQCHHTEEPAKSAAESINSVRNKEDHWIIPVEELKEDDLASNYDTTKF